MDIYAVVNNNIDSWVGITTIVSYHLTLEGAQNAIPEDIRGTKREPYRDDVIEDYGYFSIRVIEVME